MAGRGRCAGPSPDARAAPMDRTLISVPALALARVLRCLATMKAELTPDALLYHELVRTGETLCLLRTKEAIQSRPRVSGTDRKEQVDVDHAGVDEVTATNRDERTDPGLRSQKPVATARRTRSSVLY